ncbi:chemotaxis protein CheX [bacterium]|nr:chemotaxis protein CheX [bacterium]
MDVRYINPFINSLINTLKMMMDLDAVAATPFVKDNSKTSGDITGVIGFAEKKIMGSVALSFPEKAALMLFEGMTGEATDEINRDVEDCIGEVANIVAGGAKTEMAGQGLSFNISVPSVVVGQNHSIRHKAETPVIVIPFSVKDETFVMEVTMKLTD